MRERNRTRDEHDGREDRVLHGEEEVDAAEKDTHSYEGDPLHLVDEQQEEERCRCERALTRESEKECHAHQVDDRSADQGPFAIARPS